MKNNIKTLILFFLLFLTTSCSNSAPNHIEDEKENIKIALLNQQNDWNKGDIEAYMQGYWNSDSLLFIGKSGPKYGWKTTLENYKKSYPDTKAMGILKFTFLKIELLSDTNAVVIGKWELARENDKPNGYFSLIIKKINGNWKIIIDHSS